MDFLVVYKAQAPMLKADVLEMENALQGRCNTLAQGDYTLWAVGPEAALDMLRVRKNTSRVSPLTHPLRLQWEKNVETKVMITESVSAACWGRGCVRTAT